MSGDWLYDRSGPPDPEILALERQLRVFRRRARVRRVGPGLALAAVAVLAVVAGWWFTRDVRPWAADTAACTGCVWQPGTSLDTTAEARARLADRGLLVASAGTAVRRVDDSGAHLALDRGTLDVAVVAPAHWLVIDLPGVTLTDLGCAFTAEVDDAGYGRVVVRSGSVELQGTTRTELLAGAAAATWPGGHAGLPVRLDADPALFTAVDAFDRGERSDPSGILAAARASDAITLWHVLDRIPDPDGRAPVIEAIAASVHGPVDRDALLAGEPAAMRALFGRLVGETW